MNKNAVLGLWGLMVIVLVIILVYLLTRKRKHKNKHKVKTPKSGKSEGYSNISGADSTVSGAPDRLFMFADNECSPACCPGQFSCRNGCVCMTKQQQNAIATRGNNAKHQDESLI